ncbi:energy-coupling factor transporter ATPase [Frisingicoccus sp.]|uniref:energy-coupling factor transporter ATPase n=1 Tax=Frisingicoccus sp. TaxID=1918627 RepID=UPI0039995288
MGICLEHVNYIYSPDNAFRKQALRDVNLEIQDGEFIGLIGHTGSGKSTLIQHLNGLLKATSGQIYYNEQNIYDDKYRMIDLRSHVGLVFQYPEHQLFEMTVLKDVCYGPKNLGLDHDAAVERAKEALAMVGMTEKDYEKSPFELSGGQKRRVAIAGVLAMHPEVLVLDEPTAGLDPKGRNDILDRISALHKQTGITVILVSHSMEDVAKYVDRIIVMNRGEVFMDGTPKEIFRRSEDLESVGLAAPQVAYVMRQLHKIFPELPKDVTTVEEAKVALLHCLEADK